MPTLDQETLIKPSLTHYIEHGFTIIKQKYNVFFAFSESQFYENKIDDIKYVHLGAGLYCPKTHYIAFKKEYDNNYKESIKELLKNHSLESIIEYELSNHECYYTGNFIDVYEMIKDYGITYEMVKKIYYKNLNDPKFDY